jgi:predicted alpha/beta superfamily hydrolase
MNRLNKYLLLALMMWPGISFSQNGEYSFSSKHTADKYTVTIKNYNPQLRQHIVYVADGSLKLGQYILGTDAKWKAAVPSNCVIVTIAHTGDWHEKRRRDFIPSDEGGYNDEQFGRSKNFYLFLKEELFPFVNKKITNPIDRSFIGHSFSGLFSLYASLQAEKLFDKYYAISPSIWANYYELNKIEKACFDKKQQVKGKIFLYAGSLEIFNKVLSSTREYYNTLQERKYAGLSVELQEIRNANHFSVIKPAVDNIFKSIVN